MTDAYLRERAVDVKDIGQRVLRNLLGHRGARARRSPGDVVLVAHDLTLSDLALDRARRLSGIVLATGGVTSHASILAKSFEIPTVVGVEHLTDVMHEGDELIVDGNSGVVYVNPAHDVVREYERLDQASTQRLQPRARGDPRSAGGDDRRPSRARSTPTSACSAT